MGLVHLNKEDIKKTIPHRYPILLVDEAKINEDNNSAEGIFDLTSRPDLFEGHFPDYPVLPGIYLIEALAQLGALLVLHQYPDFIGRPFFFSGIEMAKFRNIVQPQDKQIILYVEIVSFKTLSGKSLAKFSGQARINNALLNTLVAEIRFSGISV